MYIHYTNYVMCIHSVSCFFALFFSECVCQLMFYFLNIFITYIFIVIYEYLNNYVVPDGYSTTFIDISMLHHSFTILRLIYVLLVSFLCVHILLYIPCCLHLNYSKYSMMSYCLLLVLLNFYWNFYFMKNIYAVNVCMYSMTEKWLSILFFKKNCCTVLMLILVKAVMSITECFLYWHRIH